MKTRILFPGLLALLILSSCIKDKKTKTYTIYRPEYQLKQSVKDELYLHPAVPMTNPGSFALYNQTMFIIEKGKGIHLVDYSLHTQPRNVGFVPIPGNQGMAIKNDCLYADCFGDLLILKILPGNALRLQNIVKGAFKVRMNVMAAGNSQYIETIWHEKDTVVNAEDYEGHHSYYDVQYATTTAFNTAANNVPGGGNVSVGSSLAMFTIVNDYLYTVDNSHLYSFLLSNPENPELKSDQIINRNDLETIFPFKDKLFLGTRTGMFIYSLQNPSLPSYLGQFNHARVCDPVIADDKFAFVTLRTGNTCGGNLNQLDIVNIESPLSPVLLKSISFSNPHGLSKDGNVLFLCDGDAGLKVLDVSNPGNAVLKQAINTGKAIDVVAFQQKAFVMLQSGIHIYAYDQQFNISLLGSLLKN